LKNERGMIDKPMVTTILQSMDIKPFMKSDMIVRLGSQSQDLFLILDGEALVFSINNELVGRLKKGSHFNNIISD
jgi:signal-transduction protein with cAMP-binding, CBS, and nucleotidyltransferase domain